MAEHIEREALLEKARELEGGVFGIPRIIVAIENAPKDDVVKVEHGEWQEIDNLVIEHGLPTVKGKTWCCSICGEARKNHTAPDMDYCPNCGAKMDLKEGAEE